jgi:uncharacterized membrane protein
VNSDDVPKWAVVNLVLSVVGVVLAVVLFVCTLLLKKKGDCGKQKGAVGAKAVGGGSGGQGCGGGDACERFVQRRRVWLVVAAMLAVVGIVVFLLTEDTRLPMGWVDRWTIVNAIIFIAIILSSLLVFKMTKQIRNANTKSASKNTQ